MFNSYKELTIEELDTNGACVEKNNNADYAKH